MKGSIKVNRYNKFRNIKTTVDNIVFDSKKEAARYQVLKVFEKIGEIKNLKLQPVYKMEVNKQLVCKYIPDFEYQNKDGTKFCEDVKGVKTPVFSLKARLFKALFPDVELIII
jgi:hypothetical protein